MATYAQEKRNRQQLLRQVNQSARTLSTRVENLQRCLKRKRSARTLLDSEDMTEINRYNDLLVQSLNAMLSRAGSMSTYIGRG